MFKFKLLVCDKRRVLIIDLGKENFFWNPKLKTFSSTDWECWFDSKNEDEVLSTFFRCQFLENSIVQV